LYSLRFDFTNSSNFILYHIGYKSDEIPRYIPIGV